jgi:hypothetical protein
MPPFMEPRYDQIPEPNPSAAVERVGGRLMVGTCDDWLHFFLDESGEPNEIGDWILERCDGTRSIRQLASMVCEDFEVDGDEALADTAGLIEALVERKVLVWKAKATGTG